MNKILILTLCLSAQILCITSKKVKYQKSFYTGAVVEYANIFNELLTPNENIQYNLLEYARFIKNAKEQFADIIVFPEYGLTSVYISQNREQALLYSFLIPDANERINPCKESKKKNSKVFHRFSEVIYQLSCEARKNKIYTVINLPERAKYNYDWVLYNTNIVFDRDGTLISKYRKYNLYNEPAFNTTICPKPETFKTDFGVTFGTMICFDILYAEPTLSLLRYEGVRDLVFSTAWMSKMPFLTAIETQAGFSKAYGVNLLASNYDNPDSYGSGSGIYSPISGIINYTIPVARQSKLLVSKIPKLKFSPDLFLMENREENLYLETLTERWDGFTTEELISNVTNKFICNNKLCCNFTIKFKEGISDYFYRMVVTDSFRSSGSNRHHVQICGIVACTDNTLESCGKRTNNKKSTKQFNDVEIAGNFIRDTKFVHFPAIVKYDLSSLPFDVYTFTFEKSFKSSIKLKINEYVTDILGISIYGRARAS